MSVRPTVTPPYLKALVNLYESGELERGAAYITEIQHDGWCPLLLGQGPCCCDFDITVTRIDTAVRGDA